MPYQNTVFINLAVTDLQRSLKFYTALGFVQNKTFSNETSAMVSLPLSPDSDPHESPIKVMLLTHPFFTSFLPEGISIADTTKTAQGILCFSRDSKDGVDDMVKKAKEAGGHINVRARNEMERTMENSGMYGDAFTDPDHHLIEVVYMPVESWEGKV